MCVSILLSIFWGGVEDMGLKKIMPSATSICVYENGDLYEYLQGSEEYTNIMNTFLEMIKVAREMPAFGVSLHNETIEAKKNGWWIEFQFNETKVHNEMPFDSLLICVEKDYMGFNLIRKHNDMYEGRCFYVDLVEKDMSELLTCLENVKR